MSSIDDSKRIRADQNIARADGYPTPASWPMTKATGTTAGRNARTAAWPIACRPRASIVATNRIERSASYQRAGDRPRGVECDITTRPGKRLTAATRDAERDSKRCSKAVWTVFSPIASTMAATRQRSAPDGWRAAQRTGSAGARVRLIFCMPGESPGRNDAMQGQESRRHKGSMYARGPCNFVRHGRG